MREISRTIKRKNKGKFGFIKGYVKSKTEIPTMKPEN